jgi:hypothetical protein
MVSTPKMKCGAPILVSAELALAPGATGTPNLSELSFGSRYAVMVDEIRFRISSISKVNPLVPGGFLQDLRGNIRVQLKIGRLDITDSFTPLWSLGRVNSNDIYYEDISADAASLVAGESRAITACVWRLPTPLYLPPSAIIQPTFQYEGGSASTIGVTLPTANINIAVAGRAILPGQPVPSRWPIPFSLFYEASPAPYAVNPGSQLVNATRHDMHVQRLTLRVWDQRNVVAVPTVRYGADWLGTTANEPAETALQYRIRDRLGTYVTKDFVAGPLLVDLNSRSWFMDTILPPDDYLRVEVQQQPNPTSTVTGLWSHVAVVGARMEEI